ncbi:C6 transcription factor, putative [Talaromyces stipitatus ATCC 10500]|uniref:C6 transcription factor, putative n=1 Tax=Talaromyces stipitatus (strain ATCC 10500 / CBS 375.48 / QM 6759 / NRRL 1006) TaxID=441959 RepID=B8MKH8_TALSN|nr:C6 transcription factor, putative [Talaromyces stipitatus ATCC 10500]EED15333.1 C6 transcription factor, putative [Talaromyces stipitatus ATCC 10500]
MQSYYLKDQQEIGNRSVIMAAEIDLLDPEPTNNSINNSPSETRPRKRRRRTVACTQCRTRKLKCDREYPACGRCLKSGIPDRCKYEDSFVWQQPNTVNAAAASTASATTTTSPPNGGVAGIDRLNGGHITLPPPNRVATGASPRFATVLPAYPKSASVTGLPAPLPLPVSSQSLPSARSHSNSAYHLGQSGTSRARFLDTVLDGPNPPTSSWSRPDGSTAHYSHAGGYQHSLATPSQRLELPNKVMIRGKETRTRFNGGGIMSNLMLQFPELKAFLHEVKTGNPNFARIRMAKDALKFSSLKHKLKERLPTIDTATLLSLLPPKPVVDMLLRLYMLYVESMHRVIHVPSFRRELSELQTNIHNPDMISAAFVAQLLLMLAAAVGFYEAEPSPDFLHDSTISKTFQVVEWIRYAEKWINTTYVKRPDLTILRIQCLLIIAKNNQGLNRSQAWLATGNLVKMAMLAGYHRDPGNIPKITLFNKEMRRRMWATIIELDAQIAIDRGMPPTLQASDFDTAPPLNINDDEIHENTTEEPQSRPVTEVTDCTFQVVLSRSLSLRLKIFSLMNSPVVSCSYEDIQKIEWELGRFQASLPTWQATTDTEISHKLTLWSAVLETKLGQALLAIHTPFAIEANEDPLFEPSSRARLEVATVILSRHLKLHETSARLSFGHSADSTVQASFSVLQHLFARRTGYTSNLLRQVLPAFTESLLDLVEKTISCMEARLLLVIKGAKQFFFLYMIFALVKAELYPDQAEEIKRLIVDRILTVTYRILRGSDGTVSLDGIDLPSISQVPSLASGNEHNTPLESLPGSFDSNNLSDLMLTPPDDFNSLLQVFDWEDFSTFPFSI